MVSGTMDLKDAADSSRASSRRDARRAEILDAAIAIIARFGLSETTMQRVASRAGISPGTITFHFARKEDLLLAALDHVVELLERARIRAMAEHRDDPAKALDAIIAASFDPKVSSRDKIAVWAAFWGEARARKIYMVRVGSADQAFHDGLKGLCDALFARHGRSGEDGEAMALAIGGLIDTLWQEALVTASRFDRQEAMRLCRAFLRSAFPGEPIWSKGEAQLNRGENT